MVTGLTGLSALAQLQVSRDENPEYDADQIHGGPADTRHGIRGEQATPYSWESKMTPGGSHGPYGLENEMLGDPDWFWTAGGTPAQDPMMDLTPSKGHGGPFPRGIMSGPVPGIDPDSVAYQRQQSIDVHAIETNADKRWTYDEQGYAQQDDWELIYDTIPGVSLQPSLPPQMKSSGYMFGTRDRVQSFARQNEFGFDSAHMYRRIATGSIPGNNMWMKPGGRPMAKTLAGPARPAIGENSPFAGDDVGAAFGDRGAVLTNTPTEYQPPALPYIAPPMATEEPGEAMWY